jgi:uncharacterized protein YheU (UPF0270 family)
MTVIPHDQLQLETLHALVEEFVTREGAIHGHVDVPIESQVASLMRQVRSGAAVIVYDEESESCSVVAPEHVRGNHDDSHVAPE